MIKLGVVIFLVLSSCTSLKIRSIAAQSKDIVDFYNADLCVIDYCPVKEFDLATSSGQNELKTNLQRLVELSKGAEKDFPKSKDMDVLIRFHLGHEALVDGAELLLFHLNRKSNNIPALTREVFSAIKNNFRPPLETDYQFLYLPLTFFKLFNFNSTEIRFQMDDDYTRDPKPSTFWVPRKHDSTDFEIGFGRPQVENFSDTICEYDKAKSGFGVHPGFHIRCGNKKYKLKLGSEVHSAAFNARVYWAMGYHVPIVDFVQTPKIQYDRKLLTQFNSRKIENFRVKLANQTLIKIDNERYYSPFDYIKEVHLKDKTIVSVSDLKSRLFYDSKRSTPELDPQNFQENFESEIEMIVMVPSSYIEKTADQEIGPWRYDQHSHSKLRELRGVQLLAAWVGNFDMRMDNSRLVRDAKTSDIKHIFSDVGSGLGESSFLLTKGSTLIEKMSWTVTRTILPSPDRSDDSERVEIHGLMNIENNKAFKAMSFEDGRWMVNKLCTITGEELKSVIEASGLRGSLADLAFNKLISRRNQMVLDFKLDSSHKYCILPFTR